MPRLLFEKKENAVWISHLDLMRLFQRAFKRAGLQLKHTQGFNPRPSVSIALPLSVGVESGCELLDFDLDGERVSCDEIHMRLNQALVAGVRVLEVYESGRKIRDIALLRCCVTLVYDHGVPADAEMAIKDLFAKPELMVERKTKNGVQAQDIVPMIRKLAVTSTGDNVLEIDAVICCQNPTLNPTQLSSAVIQHLPDFKPDFAKCTRIEIYDQDEKVFR